MRLLHGHAMHEHVLPLQLAPDGVPDMSKKTRKLALSAAFAAMAVIILYFASIWPTGQVGLAAAASVFTAAAVIEAGLLPGVYVYIISSALSLLLMPGRSAPILYALFFGYYPVIKSLIERIGWTAAQWALKLLAFNAALTVTWFLLGELLFGTRENMPGALVIYPAGNAVFALFDYGFTKIIWLYTNRVSKFGSNGGRQ